MDRLERSRTELAGQLPDQDARQQQQLGREQRSTRSDVTNEAEFRPLDGFASRITGSPDGRPWVVQANGNIFQRSAFASQL
jgi:hypothetical protein